MPSTNPETENNLNMHAYNSQITIPSTSLNKLRSELDNKAQNELLLLKNDYCGYEKLYNGRASYSKPSINYSYRTFDANDPKQFMKYVNEEPLHIYRKKFFF